jgi:hypothetical protein
VEVGQAPSLDPDSGSSLGTAVDRGSSRLSGQVRDADRFVDVSLLAALSASGRRAGALFALLARLAVGGLEVLSRLVGAAGTSPVRGAESFLAERIGLATQSGFNLAPERTASPNAHPPASGGRGLRQPVRVRRIPSGPGGPSTSPGAAERSSSSGRSSKALK